MEVRKAILTEFRNSPAGSIGSDEITAVIHRVSDKNGCSLADVWNEFAVCINEGSVRFSRGTREYYQIC